MCSVGGISLGQMIKMLVDWNWLVPVGSLLTIPPLSISVFIVLLALIYKSYSRPNRIILGTFSIFYFWFAPLIAGVSFVYWVVGLAGTGQCLANAGGVGRCYLLGVDMGSSFHAAAVMPWMVFILFPICVVSALVYCAFAARKPQG
ncbi:MAG: hypothetical protein AAF685_11420 [Cyanobacteria bacterium P01_C01_bin.89]